MKGGWSEGKSGDRLPLPLNKSRLVPSSSRGRVAPASPFPLVPPSSSAGLSPADILLARLTINGRKTRGQTSDDGTRRHQFLLLLSSASLSILMPVPLPFMAASYTIEHHHTTLLLPLDSNLPSPTWHIIKPLRNERSCD